MIAAGVTQNFPTSCTPFFGEGAALFGGPPLIGGGMFLHLSYEMAHNKYSSLTR
jgi:hypothetical protein